MPGVQLDIEPYLLPDFDEDETGFTSDLATIEGLKAAVSAHGRLSVVMPFRFSSLLYEDHPIGWTVMDRVDEVAVMSYRTDAKAVMTMPRTCCGMDSWPEFPSGRLWKPLHCRSSTILPRSGSRGPTWPTVTWMRGVACLSLGRPAEHRSEEPIEWFCIHHRYTVRPDAITFAGRSRRDVGETIRDPFARVATSSLAGIVIHDL